MKEKTQILDKTQMDKSLSRMAHEIIEKNSELEKVCLLGVKRRGLVLAEKLREKIFKFSSVKLPLGVLDISFYRDDLKKAHEEPESGSAEIPVPVDAYTMIVVDDVLYTGRTARCAMECIFAEGRAKEVQLAVLVDRGHRELPIRPDYVGKNIPTSSEELIKVMVKEYDGVDKVSIFSLP